MLAVEAPKITDWMQAWGSIAGLIMSTAALLFTGLLFRHEIRVRREEERDNRAAQARLVIPRIVGHEIVQEGGTTLLRRLKLRVTNHSPLPILNVSLYAGSRWHGQFHPGGRWETAEAVEGVFDVDLDFDPPLGLEGSEFRRDDWWIEVVFIDAAGLAWRRPGVNRPFRIISTRETAIIAEDGKHHPLWLYHPRIWVRLKIINAIRNSRIPDRLKGKYKPIPDDEIPF